MQLSHPTHKWTYTACTTKQATGVSLGLLHCRRRKVREAGGLKPISFVPLTLADGAVTVARSELEIELDGARAHVCGAVDGDVLRTVFDALRVR